MSTNTQNRAAGVPAHLSTDTRSTDAQGHPVPATMKTDGPVTARDVLDRPVTTCCGALILWSSPFACLHQWQAFRDRPVQLGWRL